MNPKLKPKLKIIRILRLLLQLQLAFMTISLDTTQASPISATPQKQECVDARASIGVIQVATLFNSTTNTCWISLHNNLGYKNLIYRDFMFGNEGLFLVFNSFGEGPPSQKTGARELYTFPRKSYPSFAVDNENQLLQIYLASGETMIFDTKTMQVLSMSDSKFIEDPQINPKNRGGFEIQSHSRILLDCGFKMGNSPTSNPKRKCQFSDSQGQTCELRAAELFNYDSDDDSTLKFQDDPSLADFLSKKCAHLDLSPLRH